MLFRSIGAAAIFPAGMAYIGEMFSREERGKAMGIWGIASGAAPAIGPLLGGYLIDWGGWRSLYYFSMLIGLLGVLAPLFILRPSKAQTQKVSGFDLAGSAWLFAGVGSILIVLNEGRTWGWISPAIIGLLVTFGVCLTAFLIHERHTENPLVDVDLLKSPFFLLLAGTAFVSFIAMQGAMFLMPFFWQNVQGYTPGNTGAMVVPLFVAMAVCSMLGGTLADRLGIRWTAALGMLTKTLALLLLGFLVIDTPYWYTGLALGLLGVGMGIALPPLSKAIIGAVPPQKMGAASGMFSMVRNLGGPFGVAILSSVFAARVADHAKAALEDLGPKLGQLHAMGAAFADTFLVAAGFVALGLVMAFFIRERWAREVAWSREALALLQKFPPEYRVRARRGLDAAFQEMGLARATPELVVEVSRRWKAQ